MNLTNNRRKNAESIWRKGVTAVDPSALVDSFARSNPSFLSLVSSASSILVVGAGKAGAAMASGLEQGISPFLSKITGLLNVPEASYPPLQKIILNLARPAGMNQPTPKAVEGSLQMLSLAENAKPNDLLIALISGGGSALLPLPVGSISLLDKQIVTSLLSASPASINELNCVRKHLSQIKGGRLAQAFLNATKNKANIVSLILSDVIEDRLDVIASGPTVADPSTFQDAIAVFERHNLLNKIPETVLNHLKSGVAGEVAETPKDLPLNIQNHILGNNALALESAAIEAKKLGYQVINLGSCLEGETEPLAIFHASIVKSIMRYGQPIKPPVCILSGGETTVKLGNNPGKGGRNQQMALAFLGALSNFGFENQALNNITFLPAGTDGEDGPTDAAGAFVDSQTLLKSGSMNIKDYLLGHNAYQYFENSDSLFKPGPTGTNVMDLRVLLVD